MNLLDALRILFGKKKKPDLNLPQGGAIHNQIELLHPLVKKRAMNAIKRLKGKGFTIVETYRTPERQKRLYAQGRFKDGNIVTNAKEMESYHNYGLALDVSDTNDDIVAAFEREGFEWGGRWKTFKDYPHFQLTYGYSISSLKKIYEEKGMESVWDAISKME